MVWVTAPGLREAREIAQAVLRARLAACANLVPRIESHYWWQGTMESATEVLMIFKTTRRRLKRLAATVRALHPYDTPEILQIGIGSGSKRYLDWIDSSVVPNGPGV